MARRTPRVFSIEPGGNFAQETVRALLAGHLLEIGSDPAALADLVIYVPTRRLKPLIEVEFARILAPRPVILPRIRPLADPGDPLEALFDPQTSAFLDPTNPGFRPLSPNERRFRLLPMVERWRSLIRAEVEGGESIGAGAVGTPIRESLALADSLGRLIDELRIASLPLEALAASAPPGYDPARFDEYWARTRDFLAIAARAWPEALETLGARDEMDLRLAAIEAEARRLAAPDCTEKVLVVGSTGSVAATARLIAAVARLDHGAVILPGLDLNIEDSAWREIGDAKASLATRFAHPQIYLKRLLGEIGITREDVTRLGAAHPRNRALSEAMRPAESVDRWRETAKGIDLDAAFSGIRVVEAADEREEALAIAVMMRETLEDENSNVALVTADRGLAQRVKIELTRWDIDVADSAGERLSERPLGRFLRLFLLAARERDAPAILALIRHPLFRLGYPGDSIPLLADALDLIVFRGRHFSQGMALPERVRRAFENPPSHPHPALERLAPSILETLPAFAAALEDALAPYSLTAPMAMLADFATRLGASLALLCRGDSHEDALALDSDAPELAALLADLSAMGGDCPLPAGALGAAMDVLLAEKILPPAQEEHPRAAILGLIEARFLDADRIIVGGLNEGSFPPVANEDPFLNRAMRLDLGLQPPERRIGQSAHDFIMLAGARDLILTRARRVEDKPALPSRFLRRIEAFAGEAVWGGLVERGEAFLTLARLLDAPESVAPWERPAPVPAEPRLPGRLSITEIETLRRDPYAIHARHLLKLEPLGPLEPLLDARERGTILHAALDGYARANPPADPEEAAALLREIGYEAFAPIRHEQELFRFWWRFFERAIPDIVAFDRERRDLGHRILTEARGKLDLSLADGTRITLSGKADRLEIDDEGHVTVLDFKTGTPPGLTSVLAGLSPQLAMTAGMAIRGAFAQIPPGSAIAGMGYIPLGGGKPAEIGWRQPKEGTLADFIAQDWGRLIRELEGFASGATPFRAHVAVALSRRGGDYDHLARAGEWEIGAQGDDEEEEGE
ncbi:MAG: double-strand break repair protein AddB [Proteobacteria bacterium]|nr:double-strand break repair protein AddB [Pseudomonadota bacterium]